MVHLGEMCQFVADYVVTEFGGEKHTQRRKCYLASRRAVAQHLVSARYAESRGSEADTRCNVACPGYHNLRRAICSTFYHQPAYASGSIGRLHIHLVAYPDAKFIALANHIYTGAERDVAHKMERHPSVKPQRTACLETRRIRTMGQKPGSHMADGTVQGVAVYGWRRDYEYFAIVPPTRDTRGVAAHRDAHYSKLGMTQFSIGHGDYLFDMPQRSLLLSVSTNVRPQR